MANRKNYIDGVFDQYKSNKEKLKTLSFDPLRAIDYSKQTTNRQNGKGCETALAAFLDDKQKIEKQVELFNRVLEYFRMEGQGKDQYIESRYINRRKLYQISMDLYVSDRSLIRWDKEIKSVAERCADLFKLWQD